MHQNIVGVNACVAVSDRQGKERGGSQGNGSRIGDMGIDQRIGW